MTEMTSVTRQSRVDSRIEGLLRRLGGVTTGQTADAEIQSQQRLFVSVALASGTAGILWGATYFLLGQPVAAAIPLGYSLLSLLFWLAFRHSSRHRFYRACQLTILLLLPFLLMVVLGGFVNSSAVILWSLIAPLGTLVFIGPRSAIGWFLGFVGLVVLSGILQPLVHIGSALPPAAILGFFLLNILVVSAIAFLMLYYFILQLRLEYARSERLLLNVLPREVAVNLKDQQQTVAESYDSVSILFADMVGFTPLSAAMSPVEMVDLLNKVFSYFDALVEKYGVEKIRTIGDSYMVASGVPRPRADHAHALAQMALDMRSYIDGEMSQLRDGLSFRIGINSGPVVAGVIGRRKFQYDLWGDAVNIASRMESQGSAGKIQIAEATYELIKDDFVCEARGTISVKGKGEMPTWFLLGQRQR